MPTWAVSTSNSLTLNGNHLTSLADNALMLNVKSGDLNPDHVALVQTFTGAYLRTALYPQDTAWSEACTTLTESPDPMGRVDCK